MRVLLVEDERSIAEDVSVTLRHAGYAVEAVGDGEEAWFRGGTESYDAVILDLGLPKLDGLTVLKRWRSEGHGFPVLVLTARGAWTERVEGINAGADDYLPKPFEMDELLARLRAVIRRSAGHAAPVLVSGPLRLDTRQMQLTAHDQPVTLSPMEYRLIAYLMHHAGRVVPATELSDHLYDIGNDRDTNAVEVTVARLRKKLGADAIETRRGFGYLVPAAAG